MFLVLTVVLIVCMLLWLFAALPFPAVAPYAVYHPILAWICVAILCVFVLGGNGGGLRRLGALASAVLGTG